MIHELSEDNRRRSFTKVEKVEVMPHDYQDIKDHLNELLDEN
jgi:hypothetical protein